MVRQVANILGADRVIYTDNGIAKLDAASGKAYQRAGAQTPANNPGTLDSALMDMALLSRCNDQIMTMASSFGWTYRCLGRLRASGYDLWQAP